MMKYQKIKLANGSEYDIAPGGLRENDDTLTIIALMGKHNLAEVDEETDNPTNTEKILLLDTEGEQEDIKKGYVYQTGCKKVKDYPVGREEIDSGEKDEEDKPIIEYQEVKETVVFIELKKADIRKEVDAMKESLGTLLLTKLGEV